MKKIYQIPEIEISEMVLSKCFLVEDSGEIGAGGNLINENATFEEEVVSTELNNSSLWEE